MMKRFLLAALALCCLALPALAQSQPTDTGNVIRVTSATTLRPIDAITHGDATGGAFAVTLPSAPAYSLQKKYTVCKTDSSANAVTVQDGSGFTHALRAQNECAEFSTNRASSSMTSVATGGEKWLVISRAGPYIIKGTVSIDPNLVGVSGLTTQTVTLTGAAVGDVLVLNDPGLVGIGLSGYRVSATNQITVTFFNPSTTVAVDHGTETFPYALIRNP